MRGARAAKDVDDWLHRLEPGQRAALERLRVQIRTAAPDAEEVISYGMPTFTLNGHLVAFGAFKNHLSFFPMNAKLIARHADKLKGFTTSKGTIRFTPDKPIPAALVKKIVKARLAQNLAIADGRMRKQAAAKAKSKSRLTAKT